MATSAMEQTREPLWTTKEVATFLHVHERTVERLALPRVRIPTGEQKCIVRFDPADVRRLKAEWTKAAPIVAQTRKPGPRQRAKAKRRKGDA